MPVTQASAAGLSKVLPYMAYTDSRL